MAKKTTHKKRQKNKLNPGYIPHWHHIRLVILSFFIGTAVYAGGMYFSKPSYQCANSRSCESDLALKIENGAAGIFEGHRVIPPEININGESEKRPVLGTNTPDPNKHIYIDLSSQTLYAYEGKNKFMETYISSGRWGRTPVGNFHIWTKIRSTRMSGGSGSDAYDLPNVPYVMYFYRDFGLHGAYWHDNFGYTMSHGCVNMRQIDALDLYEWADAPASGQSGTAVSICNRFTKPDICIQDQPLKS